MIDLEQVIQKFKKYKDAWKDIHDQYTADMRFCSGDQWDEAIAKTRKSEDRSVLVYNKLNAMRKYITNNARMQLPAIKCDPVNMRASKDTARVLDGIIKYIEYSSNSKDVFVNALNQVVVGGIGAFAIVTDYDADSNDKVSIYLRRIADPTSIYFDPSAEQSNFADAKDCFRIHWLEKEVFEAKYPDAQSTGIDNEHADWFAKDKVQIAEYWVKEDGRVVKYLITANEILESVEDYKGKYIPYVYITGEEYNIDDLREFKGIVRDVKDMQIMLNYSKSEQADYLSRSAKAQWLVEGGMISDYQDIWNSSNIAQFNYLPYSSSSAGKPERIEPVVPPAALIQASQDADADIRAAIGIRDPLQDVPQSQSGKAIKLQISEGNIGIYNFYDSLNQGILYAGRIIVDLIPYYYSEQDIIQIMGDDGQVTPIPINQPFEDQGQQKMHDLINGKYSVRLSIGPSYESQRSEALDVLVDLVGKYPAMMQLAGDLIVGNMSFQGADELAARLRANIPPQVLAASNPTNGPANPQVMQQQIMQMQEALKQGSLQLQQLQQENQQLKNEQQMRIAEINAKAQVDINLEQLKHKNDLELRMLDQRADIATQNAKAEADINKEHEKAHSQIFQKQMEHELTAQDKAIESAQSAPVVNIQL